MSADATEVAEQLGAALGGRVAALRRLSGGASRITSAFDLETPTGRRPAPHPAAVAGNRAGPAIRAVDTEAGLLRAAALPGSPCPRWSPPGQPTGSLPDGWWSNGWKVRPSPGGSCGTTSLPAPVPSLNDQAARALAAVHSIDPASVPGLPGDDPLGRPLDFLDALHEVRPVLELGARWLALGHPPRDGVGGGPR